MGFRGRVGSKGKSGKGIHDNVDPEQLNDSEDRLFLDQGDSGDEGDDDGGDIG